MLNTSPVVVGTIATTCGWTITAVGDTTNLAARLQQAAEPRSILVTEATSRLVRAEVRWESLGSIEVKGKAEPLTAYRVLSVFCP